MKKTIYSFIAAALLVIVSFINSAEATTLPSSNQPNVSSVTATTATVSISSVAYATMSSEEESRLYFEYTEPEQMCIMIYPTPENCKPKQTTPGVSPMMITGLKPNTKYSVVYKRDNTIACITTPCPGNGFTSESTTFTTLPSQTSGYLFARNLNIGSRGNDVVALQDLLRAKGYLASVSTGYYGNLTRAAVSTYQTNDMHIAPTGTVGPKSRASLNGIGIGTEETFTGSITGVSTGCFVDGECSVTVDGKKVVTTIGWSHDTVGSIRGTITDIGSLENHIGAAVKVYAKKTATGYTLYGSADYYIEVL